MPRTAGQLRPLAIIAVSQGISNSIVLIQLLKLHLWGMHHPVAEVPGVVVGEEAQPAIHPSSIDRVEFLPLLTRMLRLHLMW